MKQQRGFTLVEMAIVLVIIGLLLGAVLKGQELIENSRIKNAINDLKGLSAAYNGYLDRFHRLPGDDGPTSALQARGSAWSGVVGGDSDGAWGIARTNTFTGDGENGLFFRHLRYAGFISGNPAVTTGVEALPRNAFGGLIGVTDARVFGLPAGGRYVCMGSVPGKAARAIDTAIDDGKADSGSVRAAAGANNAAPTTGTPGVPLYSDDNTYTMCTTL